MEDPFQCWTMVTVLGSFLFCSYSMLISYLPVYAVSSHSKSRDLNLAISIKKEMRMETDHWNFLRRSHTSHLLSLQLHDQRKQHFKFRCLGTIESSAVAMPIVGLSTILFWEDRNRPDQPGNWGSEVKKEKKRKRRWAAIGWQSPPTVTGDAMAWAKQPTSGDLFRRFPVHKLRCVDSGMNHVAFQCTIGERMRI